MFKCIYIKSNKENKLLISKPKSDLMNFNRHINKILPLIPAIIMFFLVLIPTLKYQWPLSWDIIYHVQYAKIYTQYGFVMVNPLLNAPVGQNIAYPPLFHFLIVGLGNLFNIDFFQVARFLQPVLAMFIVLSVSIVAKEFYGKIAGISAGFLVISSYLIHRIILPIPENLALIFLPFAIYYYYRSIREGVLKYALISGFMFLLTLLIHPAAPQIIFLIITTFTIISLILDKNISVFKNYGVFLVFLIILLVGGGITLLLSNPDLFYNIINQGLAVIGYNPTLNYNKPISTLGYFGYIGAMVLTFTTIGLIFAIKKMQKRNIFILTWILMMILLSNAYWFGINVISYRVLIYLLIPLSIFGGFGLSQLYYKLKEYKKFSSGKFRSIFLISIFILCTFFGFLTVENPEIATFGAKTKFGYVQIAPPSDSEVDLAKWFNENGNKSRSVLISNLYSGYFLAAQAEMPVHKNFEKFNKTTPLSIFKEQKIGYIAYDKRLTFNSTNGTIYIQTAYSEFNPLYYLSGDIHSNIHEIIPNFAEVVYENKDFIVFKITY